MTVGVSGMVEDYVVYQILGIIAALVTLLIHTLALTPAPIKRISEKVNLKGTILYQLELDIKSFGSTEKEMFCYIME